MRATIVLVALFAMCSSSFGYDWERASSLLRELRDFEAYEELQKRESELQPVCTGDADVVFVLDRSRSIYPPDFEKGKVFVQDVVRLFSKTRSRFACISFAEGAIEEFGLSTYGIDQAATLNAIKNIDQRAIELGGQTETWAALRILYNTTLLPNKLRPNVQPTVLLITDGASQQSQKTAYEAKAARERGIKIIAIGVGKGSKMSELQAIATDPDKENVFMIDNYGEALTAVQKTVATQVCPSNIEGCKNNKALDVMFSVSEHAAAMATEATFGFMKSVMKKAHIGPGKIQFGLARRDCGNAWNQISLNEMDTVEGFDAAFDERVRSFKNGLAQRLSYLSRSAFRQGDQPDANNVAVVFIDKKSDIDEQVKRQASRMNGVHVIVMAGGDVTAADVRGISNDVMYFGSYANLPTKVADLSKRLCAALGRP